MVNQIFKKKIPDDIFYAFIDQINMNKNRDKKYYLINNNSFKLSKLKNYLKEFLENIKDHYYKSKQFYVDRKLTYSKFVTIIRQICKYNNIPYTSDIKYNKSTYEIQYYIYFCKK